MNTQTAEIALRRAEGATGHKPVILMTPNINVTERAWTEREYTVRANYAEAIAEAGGIPLILPFELETMISAAALADGILITGAQPGAEVAPQRRECERTLVGIAIEARKPLLGICHGMQLIGEYLGGTFVAALPTGAGMPPTDHMPSAIPDGLAHDILLAPESELVGWAGSTAAQVNSLHRHMLTGMGRFRVAARAPDGVIEAFEGTADGFCLGIQWHPEYRLTEFDRAILKNFVERSARHARPGIAPGAFREELCAVRQRLSALGLALPEPAVPPGAFVGAIRNGTIVTVSGQVPLREKAVIKRGHLGTDVSIEEGRESARWALLNALAQLEGIAGGLDRVAGFIRLAGYVAASPDFTQHGTVVDGASELLREIFPDRWPHARVALGVASLPRGVPVEIELTASLATEGL
ncbi:Atu1372/SO_1960 family protein [Mesorhizobium cantuariense]|uniref:Atu1372/SO_1960 family protein n=1 Tax=Mesorhizobium cantuariense TaxID=1300275 RepID=A0ABV7MP58_9HYPH